ncbi:MAG: glycosyltransferase [Bacteroidia bacterium]|nr:glycosyltransferase [Bacteroidia bacterium]
MKVTHLSTSDLGGAGIAAKNLHLALLQNGIASSFVSKWQLGPEFEGGSKLTEAAPNVTHRIKNALLSRLWPQLLQAPEELILKNRNPKWEHFSFPWADSDPFSHSAISTADIIHLNWVADGFMDYNKVFVPEKKYVWTLHDMNPFTGGCHHSDGCEKFTDTCNFCPQLSGERNQYASNVIFNYKLKALSAINSQDMVVVAPSQWLSTLASKSSLLGRFKHLTIPNIINWPQQTLNRSALRNENGITENETLFLFVAHHYDNPRKGVAVLLKALEALKDENYKVYVVGNELGQIKNPHIKICGYISDKTKLMELYSMADAFLLPSVAENFPNTIVEALLCGTPVIASNVGGIPEQINNSNGLLVQSHTSEAWTEVIKNFISHKQSFNREIIKQEAQKKYATTNIIEKYMAVYQMLVNQKSTT